MRGRLVRAPQPRWIEPMLATLSGEHFFDAGWIYEPKLDGIRCLAFKRGGEVELYSRNRNILNARFPGVAEALREQPADGIILDGEVVACEGGRSSFSLLQGRSRPAASPLRAPADIYYYVFDVLYFGGYDVTGLPLLGRKWLLEKAVDFSDAVRYLSHIPDVDEAYLRDACGEGREGLMAKRAAGLYVSGRSRDWLKFKCVRGQEFVIGGYTEPRGGRTGFGALLLGYREAGKLRYAGKVGTGFSESALSDLHRRLSGMERKTSPFGDSLDEKGVHWVKPALVAQIGFAEWTPDGRLRHPRFLGLRGDVDPGEVTREVPAEPKRRR
ncbi:MAG: non-homologous end-joining DNA ligase [Actinomycetota bacterium]